MTQTPLELQQPDVAAAVEDEVTARRAEEICAHLLIHRWLPKRSTRDLLIDDRLRASVERRLDGVGLQLIDSYTSSYFAVRLKPAIESDVRFDWATNARLPRGAVALLVILWTRLVLPRRVASDEARRRRMEDPEGEAPAKERLPTPMVARSALYAEFGHRFGKIAFARYVSLLKSNGFLLENRQGQLREGPLLDVLVDGVTMARKLRDSVLWDLMERDTNAEVGEGELQGLDQSAGTPRKAAPRRKTKAEEGAASSRARATRGAADADADEADDDETAATSGDNRRGDRRARGTMGHRDDPTTVALVAQASAVLRQDGGDDEGELGDGELGGRKFGDGELDEAELDNVDDVFDDGEEPGDDEGEELADERPARSTRDDDDDFGDWGDP